MVLTIWMACSVKSIKQKITLDIRRVNLHQAGRSLEKTLSNIRKLHDAQSVNSRGRAKSALFEEIQTQFDSALMQIDIAGPDSDVRSMVVDAQQKMQKLKNEASASACETLASEMQSLIQDAVSSINGRSLRLEGKAQ